MSCDHRKTIVSMFDAIDSNSWHALKSFFHPEIVYIRPGYSPIVGLEDLVDFYVSRRIISKGHHSIESICTGADGTVLSAFGSFEGVDRTGHARSVRFCDVYRIESGTIRLRETFFNSPAL